MRVEEAAGILEDYLGSGSDPIWINGVETTPEALIYSERADDNARRLRITYYGSRGRHTETGCHHHLDGLQTLCTECHRAKTRRDLRGMADDRRGQLTLELGVRDTSGRDTG